MTLIPVMIFTAGASRTVTEDMLKSRLI